MDITGELTIPLIAWFAAIAATCWIADRKGLSMAGFAVAATIAAPLALVLVLIMPTLRDRAD